jgi:hypothetical protein
MESLDHFRRSWRQEICKDTSSEQHNDISQTPTGDLCRLGSGLKRSLNDDASIPMALHSNPLFSSTDSFSSFTIGIRKFVVSSAKSSCVKKLRQEETTKNSKSLPITLIDELIRDIDESTSIPFFNLDLPREIALKIFEYLSMKDLYACLQVCKAWHSLSSDDILWWNIYKQFKFDHVKHMDDQCWKTNVSTGIIHNRMLTKNFRNHQCRTTKLTYRLGVVLTCANNDSTTIVAGYSTGIIRTWSIKSILDIKETMDDTEYMNTSDIIYESIDVDQDTDLSCVKSVGLMKNDIYAIHDNSLVEIWTRNISDKPWYTKKLSSTIEHIANDEHHVCASSRSIFSVLNFNQVSFTFVA